MPHEALRSTSLHTDAPQTSVFAIGRWKSARFLAAGILFLAGCSRDPVANEAKHMKRGLEDLAKKDYKKAVVEFKVASQNMPKDAEPVYQLGMTYLAGGASKQAVEAFTKANGLNPKHEGAQYQMALVKVGSNKPEVLEDAKKVLSAHLRTSPDDAEALGALALAQAKLGDKAQAWELLRKATEKNPSNTRPATVVIAFYAARGDVDTAKQIAHDLAEDLPKSPETAVLRAQVALATKDLADADAQISRALSLKRDFRPALELRLRRELMNQNTSGAEEITQELAKLPERRSWATYGRMLFAEKKIDQGIAEYNRVLKEHNDDPAIRDEYSGLLIAANRRKEAEDVVGGTLGKNPKDKSALLQRATLEIDKGSLDAAAKDVKTLQEEKAFSAQLSYQESRIFGARGETIREGDLLAEALKANPRFLAARLELARLLVSSGKPKVALDTLDQANAAEKNTAEYVYYRNMALMANGDWDEAKKSIDHVLSISRSAGFLYQDAMLKSRSHDLAGARKSLDAAYAMAPADPQMLILLGNVMKQQNEAPKYLALLKETAAKNPGSAAVQDILAGELEHSGDAKGARSAFEAARSGGDVQNATNQLALLDMRTGAVDQAKQRLAELIKTHDNAASRLMLAEIETRKGASPNVIVAHYLKALELEPTNVVTMNNLANVLASRQNKFEDALFWAQKALGLAPASPVIEDTIGWIYYRQGKYDAALPYLQKSLKAADRPVAHYHLAAALARSGDPNGGRKEFDIALRQDPKSEERAAVAPLFTGK